MRRKIANNETVPAATAPEMKPTGTQALLRALDIVDAIADGAGDINDIAAQLRLARSTANRLAKALVERRYLALTPRNGYRLGPKLLDLGAVAHRQIDLIQVARPLLEDLSRSTLDTIHLGVRSDGETLYLDKIPGTRRLEIRSRIGERQPLHSTGLGKALLLGATVDEWDAILDQEKVVDKAARRQWHKRMSEYQSAGRAYDLEENEERVRCVAAPVRDATGSIVAAISLTSATQYMSDARMADLSPQVCATASAISLQLGWREGQKS